MPAQFPGKVLFDGYAESWRTLAIRTQVEAGPPKQRHLRDRRLHRRSIRVICTAAQYDAFRAWYENDVEGGSRWFDYVEPGGGPMVQARIVGGEVASVEWYNAHRTHCAIAFDIEHYG